MANSYQPIPDAEVPESRVSAEELETRRKLYLACLVCGCFMIVELVGGIFAGSLAIITDAAHLMTDLSAFALAIFASILAAHGATPEFSYGFKRAEVLSALASTLMIWVLTAVLLYEACIRANQWFHNKAEPVDGRLMFIIAVLGIGVNIALERVLGDSHAHFHSHAHHGHDHGHDHGHGGTTEEHHAVVRDRSPSSEFGHEHHHGHDHAHKEEHHHDHGHDHKHKHDHDHCDHSSGSHDVEYGSISNSEQAEQRRNVNLDAAYLHVLGDLVQSIGVAIAGLVIWWKPHWQIIDPICTFLFGILVMFTTMSMLWQNIQVLLEGVPDEIDVAVLRTKLEKIQDDKGESIVTDVHDLHVWGLTSGTVILTAHMHAKKPSLALKKAHAACQKMGINHITIQMQSSDEDCVSENCCD